MFRVLFQQFFLTVVFGLGHGMVSRSVWGACELRVEKTHSMALDHYLVLLTRQICRVWVVESQCVTAISTLSSHWRWCMGSVRGEEHACQCELRVEIMILSMALDHYLVILTRQICRVWVVESQCETAISTLSSH